MGPLRYAAEQTAAGNALTDWVPLIVALVGGVSALTVALWNTRGESADLRKLKAMNEAAGGLPPGGAVASQFAAARDLLAERIAARITGPSLRARFAMWAAGAGVGVAVVLAGWWFVSTRDDASGALAAIIVSVGGVVASLWAAIASATRWWRTGIANARLEAQQREVEKLREKLRSTGGDDPPQ